MFMYEIYKFLGHLGTVATLVAVNFGHSWGDFIKSSIEALFPFFPHVVDIDSCW